MLKINYKDKKRFENCFKSLYIKEMKYDFFIYIHKQNR